VFVDERMEPFEDQWSYLAGLPRLNREGVERILARISPLAPPESNFSSEPSLEHDFALQNDAAVLDISSARIRSGMLTGEITIRLDAQIHVPRSLPAPVLA